MDLNDPRRRLQVLQQNNPSLRVSVAPAQKLTIQTGNQNTGASPQVTINRDPNTRTSSVKEQKALAQPDPTAAEHTLHFLGDVGKTTVDSTVGPLGRGIARLLPGGQNDLKANEQAQAAQDANLKVYSDLYKAGKIDKAQYSKYLQSIGSGYAELGHESQRIADTADRSQVVGSAIQTAALPFVGAGEVGSRLLPNIALRAGEGVGLGATAEIAINKDPTAEDIAKSGAIGGALGGLFAPAAKVVGKIFGKGNGKVSSAIANESDPVAIKAALNVDDATAQYLATETDKKVVESVLRELNIDPNLSISQTTRDRLQNEGITDVQQGETPYGAEYDGNGIIKVRDQSFATDPNLFHEVGHHIYDTKLTPEEKTVFEKVHGAARQQAEAEGRTGYDLASEDFSDYVSKALSGHLDEVPEELRPIIQKYSGDVEQAVQNHPANLPQSDLDAIKEAGGDVSKLLPARTASVPGPVRGEGFVMSDTVNADAVQLGKQIKKIDSQLEKVRQGTSTLSADEIRALTAQREELVGKVNGAPAADAVTPPVAPATTEAAKTEQAVLGPEGQQAVAPAGGPEAQVPNPNETAQPVSNNTADIPNSASDTKPGERLTTYTDPKTGKVTTKTQDDLINEASEIRAIAKDKRTVAQAERLKEIRKTLKNWEESSTPGTKPTVDDLYPSLSPEDKQQVQEIMDQLDKAKEADNAVGGTRSQERAQRIAAGESAYKAAGGGQAGMRAKKAALKGELTKPDRVTVTPEEGYKSKVYDDIENDSNLLGYEKLNTQNAFETLFGDVDEPLTKGKQAKIKDYYNSQEEGLGDVIAKQIDEAVNSGETIDMVEQIAGAPRTLMTVGDASAPRQLAVSIARHPIVTTKAYLKSFAHMFSGQKFEQSTQQLEKMTDSQGRNYSEFMGDVMHIHLPNLAERAAEETMSSAPLFTKAANIDTSGVARKFFLPVKAVGKVVEGSNRGMSSAVAHTRFNLAKKFIDDAGGVEGATKLFSEKELSDLGEVLDTITGRGGKKGGFTEQHAKILSNTLFSGKLWASRVNMLNPYWYYRLSGPARKEALASAASFAATAGTTLELIDHIPGVDVGWDPTSADFAKIKVGNTRFDILGGFQQNIRVVAQIATGRRTNSETGETKPTTISSVIGGLVEGKANPLIGYSYKIANTTDDPDSSNPLVRKDEWGNQMNIGKEAGSLVVPLPVSGVKETMDDQGSVKGAIMSVPGFFGAGEQTYGNIKTKDQGKDSKGNLTFKGKVTEDMVKGLDGKVLLDDKGKPVKATFPKDASDLEKKAIMDEKRHSALSDAYKRTLSKEDQALFKLSDEKLKEYVKDGTIDQARYDKIQNYQKTAESQGKENKYTVPDGVKSAQATSFYQKYNSMNEKDQKAWLKQAPDDNAKSIATEINKTRAPGLSEFKASNALSKAYSEYEKDINNHPEYTEVDKRNKAKAFQVFSAKLNYNDMVKDLYSEGGSSDVKTLMSEKQVSKEDLDNAIKLDNELYASGLTGSLKFSKKFRNSYGVATPDGPGGASSGSGGGKSGKDANGDGVDDYNAHLSALIPSFKTGSGDKPEFSSRKRGLAFKGANVSGNAKGTSNSKKISIKL